MKISREVKVSDDNYGNTTQRLEFEIKSFQAPQVNDLLNRWEAIIRRGVCTHVSNEDMTVREAKEYEAARRELNDVLEQLAVYTEES